jgi:hypothetical protein
MNPRSTDRLAAAAVALRRATAGWALLAAAAVAGAAVPPEFAPAVAAAERGEAVECARLFTAIAQGATQRGLARRAHYGAAVCAATAGELDGAFAALTAALTLDFHDADRFYDDPRLRPLRVDARWPALEAVFHGAVDRWRAGLNAELDALYRADQADRSGGPGGIAWTEVSPRDEQRERRVRAILASGVELGADDRYHAAMVLQHGEDREDYELAHELARRAAEDDADHPHARWLAAATLDRALIAAGVPQRYGTQSIVEGGRWVLAPVDPTVDDAERARWDVPPLAESRARAEAMNGGGAPAAATPPSESPTESLPESLPAAPPAGR